MSDIAYQNKDIVSKIFGHGLKEKSLEVYGIPMSRVVNVLPVNLPAIEASERIISLSRKIILWH